MSLRREQFVFGAALILAGSLTAMEWGDRYERVRVPRATLLEPEDLPATPRVVTSHARVDEARLRDTPLFAPPRELLPLEPLILPAPPTPPLSVRRPSVVPGLAGPAARAYRIAATDLGGLDLGPGNEDPFGDVADTANALGTFGGDDGGSASAATGTRNAAAVAEDAGPDDMLLETRFDWFARLEATRRVYGRILNEDPHGLRGRLDEALLFQQVSTTSGRPLGSAFPIPRAEVASFGLARTFANEAIARARELGTGRGSASTRRAFALELFEARADEPEALAFAEQEARLAAAADPGDASGARLLAWILRERQDLEGELSVYRRAEEGGNADGALLAAYAGLCRRLGLPERAEELLRQAALKDRTAAEIALLQGRLLMDKGRYDEALQRLDAAEGLPFAGPLEGEQRRELLLELGRCLIATGDLTAAARRVDRLLLDDAEDADALVLAGAAAAAAGDLEAADTAFSSALAVMPDDGLALYDAGLVAWRARDGAAARRLLEQAVDRSPLDAVRPTLALGFLYEDAAQPEAARELYAAALGIEPDNADALYRLGRNQRLDGDPEEATLILREALGIAGPDVLLLAELGVAALDRGQPDEARRYFDEALRLQPGDAEIEWLSGLAALTAGDVLSVAAPLEAAAAAGAPGARTALGVALYRQGREVEALDQFDEVLKAYAGRSEDPQAVYAATWGEAIRVHRSKRQWLDHFRRSSLQRGWSEHQWDGSPSVWFVPGEVHVDGRMDKPRSDERPGLSRIVEGRSFDAAVAELTAAEGADTRYGVSLTYRQVKGAQGRLPKARLDLWIDAQGSVRASVLDNFDVILLDGVELPVAPIPQGETVTLGIRRIDVAAGTFDFTVNGRPVGDPVDVKSLRNFKNPFDLEIYAEAAPGGRSDAIISLCRVVQVP